MSSEVYYDPLLESRRRAELILAWQNELNRKTKIEIEKINLEIQNAKNRLSNLSRVITVNVGAKKEVYGDCVCEEWNSSLKNNDSKKEFIGTLEFNNIDVCKGNELDFSSSIVRNEACYDLEWLKNYKVKNNSELLKKRSLLLELGGGKCKDTMEISKKIASFVSNCHNLSDDEKIVMGQYSAMNEEMNISLPEKCFDEVIAELPLLTKRYYLWKEKEYIHNNLVRILAEEGVLYEGQVDENNIRKGSYTVDNDLDTALHITEQGAKRILVEFVGLKSSDIVSDEERKVAANKGKEVCKKINKVVQRMNDECGIIMNISNLVEPEVDNVKFVEKKNRVSKRKKENEKRVMYEV